MFKSAASYLRRHHIGLIALAIACTGTAYAATTIGSKQIKNESIRSADIKAGAVKSADLNDNADDTASATVLEGQLLNADGFSNVTHPAVGTYVMTIADGAEVCNVATGLIQPLGSGAPNSTVALSAYGDNQLTIVTADSTGALADAGPALGYSGFSIIGTC